MRCVTFAAVSAAVLLAGCGGSHARAPITPKPGATTAPAKQAPSCPPAVEAEIRAGKGQLGNCSPEGPKVVKPAPKAGTASASRATVYVNGPTGPDVSNNDPVYSWGPVRVAGHPFAFAKLNQGTGFVDQTAQGQVSGMHAARVAAGGYDFLEVCRAAPVTEARLFLARRDATHATDLPAAGDAEWPLSVPCSSSTARAWVNAWVQTVYAATHRAVVLYTGAWWWNPNIGCWWPAHAIPWISGYGVSFPAVPCGAPGVSLWQYTDRGWNGVSHSDMSVLRVPLASLTAVAETAAEKRARLWRDYRVRAALLRVIAIRRAVLTHHDCKHHHSHGCTVVKARGDASHKHLREVQAAINGLHFQQHVY